MLDVRNLGAPEGGAADRVDLLPGGARDVGGEHALDPEEVVDSVRGGVTGGRGGVEDSDGLAGTHEDQGGLQACGTAAHDGHIDALLGGVDEGALRGFGLRGSLLRAGGAADRNGRAGRDLRGRRGVGLLRIDAELGEREGVGDAGEGVPSGDDGGGKLAQSELLDTLGKGLHLDHGRLDLVGVEGELVGSGDRLGGGGVSHGAHYRDGEGFGETVEDSGEGSGRERRGGEGRDHLDQNLQEVACGQAVVAQGRSAAPTTQEQGGHTLDPPALDEFGGSAWNSWVTRRSFWETPVMSSRVSFVGAQAGQGLRGAAPGTMSPLSLWWK